MIYKLKSGKILDFETHKIYENMCIYDKESKQLQNSNTVSQNIFHLVILPTEKCNFKCVYCYEKLDGPKWEVDNEYILYEFIDNLLLEYDGIILEWFGGEPLLEFDVIERVTSKVLKKCIFEKKVFSCGITTNGYLLSVEKMKRLLKAGVSSYQITLDGIASSHNKKRVRKDGSQSYETILYNLKNISALHYPHFRIVIRLNLTRSDLLEIKEHSEYLSEQFKNDSRIGYYIRPVGNWGGERVKSIADQLLGIKEMFEFVVKSNINLNFEPQFDMLFDSTCYAANDNSVIVGPDLRLMKCTMLLDEPKNQLGNLLESQSETLFSTYSLKPIYTEECLKCQTREICEGYSCPISKRQKIDEPQCSYELENIDLILELIDNENTMDSLYQHGSYIKNR